MMQATLVVGIIVSALFLLWALSAVLKARQELGPLAAGIIFLVASPVAAFLLRHGLENGYPDRQFSFSTQSWAFLFDALTLTPAIMVAAVAWHRRGISEVALVQQWWWLPLSIGMGFAAGALFHAIDVSAYADIPGAIVSPTKVQHDFLAYTVLFGGLLYAGVPLLQKETMGFAIVVSILIALWAIVGLGHDMRPGALKAHELHGGWDAVKFEPIRFTPTQ